jgi:cell division protein FtsB
MIVPQASARYYGGHMADFRQRQRARRLLYSKVTVILLVGIGVLIGRQVWDIYQKDQRAQEAEALSQAQYDELVQRNSFLNTELASLNTTEGVEAKLREQFNVARPGEKVAVLLPSSEATSSTSTVSASWWHSLWSWIFQ